MVLQTSQQIVWIVYRVWPNEYVLDIIADREPCWLHPSDLCCSPGCLPCAEIPVALWGCLQVELSLGRFCVYDVKEMDPTVAWLAGGRRPNVPELLLYERAEDNIPVFGGGTSLWSDGSQMVSMGNITHHLGYVPSGFHDNPYTYGCGIDPYEQQHLYMSPYCRQRTSLRLKYICDSITLLLSIRPYLR